MAQFLTANGVEVTDEERRSVSDVFNDKDVKFIVDMYLYAYNIHRGLTEASFRKRRRYAVRGAMLLMKKAAMRQWRYRRRSIPALGNAMIDYVADTGEMPLDLTLIAQWMRKQNMGYYRDKRMILDTERRLTKLQAETK